MSCICPVCGFPGLETAPRDSQDGPPHPAPHGNNMAPLFVSTSPGINHYPWSAVMRLTTKTLAPFALSLIGLVAIACCGSAAAPSSPTAPTPTATSAGVAAAIGRYLRGRRRIPRGASRLLLACRGYAGRGRCGLRRPAAGGLSCNSWRGPASNTNVRTRWIRCRRASDRSMLDRSSDRPRKLNSSKCKVVGEAGLEPAASTSRRGH